MQSLINETTAWRLRQQYNASFPMNTAYPNGQYTFTIKGSADGNHTNNYTLNADFYPLPPHVSNFAAAQQIDITKDFSLQWDATGQKDTDLLQVELFDSGGQKLFETGNYPGAANAVKGNATSIVLSHTLFAEGRAYRVRLTSWSIMQRDTASYPGAYGFVGYITSTDIPIQAKFNVTDVQWYGVMRKQRLMVEKA